MCIYTHTYTNIHAIYMYFPPHVAQAGLNLICGWGQSSTSTFPASISRDRWDYRCILPQPVPGLELGSSWMLASTLLSPIVIAAVIVITASHSLMAVLLLVTWMVVTIFFVWFLFLDFPLYPVGHFSLLSSGWRWVSQSPCLSAF